jgi:hypothetical protein
MVHSVPGAGEGATLPPSSTAVPSAALPPRLLRRLAVLLYIFVAAVYLLTGSARMGNSDAGSMFDVTRNMFTRRSIDAEPCVAEVAGNQCVPGIDGRNYSGYGVISSAIAYPAFAVGWYASKALHKEPEMLAGSTISLGNALLGALVPVVLFLWTLRIGFSPKVALITALTLAFATPYWFHSVKGFHSEPHFALGFLTSCYMLSLPRMKGSALLAGLCFGVAVGCRVYGLILTPFLLWYLWRTSLRVGDDNRAMFARLVQFGIGLGIFLAIIGTFNTIRFGSPLKSGYHMAFPTLPRLLGTPFFFGLMHLLFSGRVGLFWFTPVLLLLIFAAKRFWTTHRDEAVLCFGVGLASILFFAKYTAWDGGWSYGPRLLTPTIPLMILPLAALFSRFWGRDKEKHPGGVLPITVGILALSFLVQLPGLGSSMSRYYYLVKYNDKAGVTPWYGGSSLLAAVDAVPGYLHPPDPNAPIPDLPKGSDGELVSVQGITAQQYLMSLPNGINQAAADLWLVKAPIMGLPKAAPIAGFLVLGGVAIAAFLNLRSGIQRAEDELSTATPAPQGAV